MYVFVCVYVYTYTYLNEYSSHTLSLSLRPAPEGDDITSMLGPGQVPPKPSLGKNIASEFNSQ